MGGFSHEGPKMERRLGLLALTAASLAGGPNRPTNAKRPTFHFPLNQGGRDARAPGTAANKTSRRNWPAYTTLTTPGSTNTSFAETRLASKPNSVPTARQ
jgi:hypothetical protein